MSLVLRGAVGALVALCAAAGPATAAGGPVAVRWWGQSFVTIETYWNLTVAIDPYALSIGYDDPGVGADVVLITHEHFDHDNWKLLRGTPRVIQAVDERRGVRPVDLILDRPPDEPSPRAFKTGALAAGPHAVRLRAIAAFHDDEQGRVRGRNAMYLVETAGVRILHCGDLGQSKLTDEQLEAIGAVDVLLVPAGGLHTIDGAQAAVIAETLRPRFVVPMHYKTGELTIDLEPVDGLLEALPERYERVEPPGNTLAVSAGRGPTADEPRVVLLKARPWTMPEELAALYAAKEAAAAGAQRVFAPLSAAQMNHRPADGTHTPRWNAEHMMGRELGFFSAIFAARDPAIAPLELNPAQMPEDYEPAHPDWSGEEESRQIARVEAFTRRHAYLLDGLDLDAKPEGSPWPLRRLFEQMARHYAHHSANVRKKFELPDWPGD